MSHGGSYLYYTFNRPTNMYGVAPYSICRLYVLCIKKLLSLRVSNEYRCFFYFRAFTYFHLFSVFVHSKCILVVAVQIRLYHFLPQNSNFKCGCPLLVFHLLF